MKEMTVDGIEIRDLDGHWLENGKLTEMEFTIVNGELYHRLTELEATEVATVKARVRDHGKIVEVEIEDDIPFHLFSDGSRFEVPAETARRGMERRKQEGVAR